MFYLELASLAAFFLVQLLGPAVWGATSRWAKSQVLPLSPIFWLAFALAFHLVSSILFRLLCNLLPMPYWVYAGAHLLGWGYWFYRHKDQKAWIGEKLLGFTKLVFSGTGLSFLLGLIFVTQMFIRYQNKPAQIYFQDEQQRASIAQAITIAYPPPEFQVYSHSTYRYYNFAEVFAVNLAQFSHMPVVDVYMHQLLIFNWLLIFVGFWALAGAHSKRSGWIVVPLFMMFFLVQGPGGAEKILHFTLRQNTFALGLSLVAVALFLKFLDGKGKAYFYLGLTLVALITGVKLLAVTPLVAALPLIGLWALVRQRIKVVELGLGAVALVVAVLGIYRMVIYNPSLTAHQGLIYDTAHYWVGFYERQMVTPYHNTLFGWLQTYGEAHWGGTKLGLWMPFFYCLEFVALALAGWAMWGRKDFFRRPGPLFVILGGWASMEVFMLFRFDIGGSSSSIEYFLFFGAWLVSAQGAAVFAEGVAKTRNWGAAVMMVMVVLISMNLYQFKDMYAFEGLDNHFGHTSPEVNACKDLIQRSEPQDWVLHNYYRYPSMWSFNSLCARRAVLSSQVRGAINQDNLVYDAIRPLADRYFLGQMDQAEAAQFLANHEVKWVMWNYRLTDMLPSGQALLETVFDAQENVTLYRVRQEMLPPRGEPGTALPPGAKAPAPPVP
ncbi:MAG: hypothetical protein A2600_03800 [Candidatus Lambdaproteobacteria bacterium RIFOXYD1_FULL_56_27]|uniref:Glycosyltransferase RgtA/B/C/D-like domain-containing protein n=1 Tax=Candidatus Lambdaproteobacteria bacterium RIFOXYD2_FULL_56_26 TaxID=1817773 RepID=A0A1F6H3C8_9PROT|nr:MAG: hypothetical protein A2426_11210 [Candidatus Lambdaproteobacteria bacterium RIFOXYC1_FULL_56_13]OGH04885.1 MAG: hypothetical protein A2557_07865 [Candidatus Lambdaproteobacteria bacterium RIFOXYD2_FULL_56_26]OGH09350.1 MAG: hypothetical protein A2600_03800 [Candidatus Lambdaproteobacteria bacterium RIFOXYD1_FULL_56_27]